MSTTVAPTEFSAAAIVHGVTEIAKAFLNRNSITHAALPGFLRSISRELTAAALTQAPNMVPAIAAPFTGETKEQATLPAPDAPESSMPELAKSDNRWAGLSKVPVIPVEDSVTNDAVICLFDGTPKKMLKRYIRAKYGMEEHEYKAWFGLPADYPMVAPGYAAEKATVAIAQGLGSKIDKTPRHLRAEIAA